MPAAFSTYLSRQFQSLVLQNTSLCNLDCAYCYLPGRDSRRQMSVAVAAAVARSVDEQDGPWPVEVAWHAGEPMTMPLPEFERLLQQFEPLRRRGRIAHRVQTNATMVNSRWCELFRRYDVSVGVSVDGPPWANINRRDHAGRQTHGRTMRGVARLREHGVPVSAICVVNSENIARPDELVSYFEDLGLRWINFNMEEREAANVERDAVAVGPAAAFWHGVLRRKMAGSPLRVRQVELLASYLAATRYGRKQSWMDAQREPVPSIAWNGDVVLLSPELVDVKSVRYGDFVVGNVLRRSLPAILTSAHESRYVAEFVHGLEACRSRCSFFAYCRGAQAANRYFEHGDFAATETGHCRNTRQALATALAEIIAGGPVQDPVGYLEQARSGVLGDLMMTILDDLQRTG